MYSRFEAAARAAREKAARQVQDAVTRGVETIIYPEVADVMQKANQLKERMDPMATMDLNPRTLVKTKTFWAGVAALLASAGGYATGEMNAGMAVQTALTGLIGIFLRSGMLK